MMWCGKCRNELADCTCPDLQERLQAAGAGGHFVYRMCAACKQHYAKCKCEQPVWILSNEIEP